MFKVSVLMEKSGLAGERPWTAAHASYQLVDIIVT
jgi:hypothetical protein